MEKLKTIEELLEELESEIGNDFVSDKQAILAEYQNKDIGQPGIAIKLLSVFGGFLASLALFGFMGIAGVFDSEYGILVVGTGAIIFSWILNKKVNNLIFDTFSVSIFIIGVVSLAFGLLNLNLDENTVIFMIIAIALASLYVMQNYILSFVSTVAIGACLLTWIISNDLYDFIHIYITFYALLMGFWFLYEAKIMSFSAKLSLLYSPLRIGIVISFLFGLITLGIRGLIPLDQNYIWISSVFICAGVLFLVHNIIRIVEMEESKHKSPIYGLTALFLLPTIFCPSISGAILIVLLGFYVNHKTSFIIGIVALVYFVSQYYYDLSFSLLTKSLILISSGAMLLVFYVFIQKMLKENEKK